MQIDVHAHSTERSYYEELERLPGVTVHQGSGAISFLKRDGKNWLPFWPHMFDPDHLLRDMDAKGIDVRVLSLSTPSVYDFPDTERIRVCREQNDAIIARVARSPDRLRAVITLPLPDIEASIAEFERVVGAPGIVGLALGSNLKGMPLSDLRLDPIWTLVDDRRLPVIEHPMLPTFAAAMDEFALPVRVGFLYDTSLALTRMIYAGVFERFPNFPFVVAHTGAAFVDLFERLDNGFRNYADCRQHITRLPSEYAKQFYYDTCSFFPPFIQMVKTVVGGARLMFGTDYPFIDTDDSHVQALDVTTVEREMILGGNAQQLFRIQ